MASGAAQTPRNLRLHAASRLLEMQWESGRSTYLPHRLLRERCPCAQCRQARRATTAAPVPAAVSVIAIQPYGSNAVHLTFSDGHARGIFPFEYLHQLGEECKEPE